MTFVTKLGAKHVVEQLAKAGQFNRDLHKNDRGLISNGRERLGKTLRDHRTGAWRNRFDNKRRPIRCTSSHKSMGHDTRTIQFWGG